LEEMSRPLLLDTCVAMFLVANEPINKSANNAIDRAVDARMPVHVSPITAWEVGQLARKGRFRSPFSPQRWFEVLRALPGIAICELSAEILMESSFLPGDLHKDPADRIIAATARELGYALVTRDRALLRYGEQGHVAVVKG
jgi:PIN domain nuclease of toxin-antitoxin system